MNDNENFWVCKATAYAFKTYFKNLGFFGAIFLLIFGIALVCDLLNVPLIPFKPTPYSTTPQFHYRILQMVLLGIIFWYCITIKRLCIINYSSQTFRFRDLFKFENFKQGLLAKKEFPRAYRFILMCLLLVLSVMLWIIISLISIIPLWKILFSIGFENKWYKFLQERLVILLALSLVIFWLFGFIVPILLMMKTSIQKQLLNSEFNEEYKS